MTMERPACRRGFSYIEIIAVVVITTVLVAIAQPRMADYMLRARTEQAGSRMVADIRYAQIEAIKRQAPVAVQFDPGGDYYQVVTMPDETLLQMPAAPGKPFVVRLGEDSDYKVDLAAADLGDDGCLEFNRFGQPAAGAQIIITNGERACLISVNATTGRATTLLYFLDAPPDLPLPDLPEIPQL